MSNFQIPSGLDLSSFMPGMNPGQEDDITIVPPKVQAKPAPNFGLIGRLMREKAARQKEALKLYRPLPLGQKIHECMAPEVIVGGGNQTSKTTTLVAEMSWVATGTHPIAHKWPRRDGIAYLVGYDEHHLARTLYKKLFEPGAFEIIRDEQTRMWRVVLPNDEADIARKDEWRQAPPFIPRRFIKKMNFAKAGEKILNSVQFTTGWWFYFHSSRSHPEQGTQIDLLFIDEQLELEEWYVEGSARLQKRKGRLLWSATDQDISPNLLNLQKRAEEEADKPNPAVVSFQMMPQDNIYMPREGQAQFAAKLGDEDYAIRVLGQSSLGNQRVFPDFHPETHRYDHPCFALGYPPPDWCNFMIVDPGFNPTAVLFASLPPPQKIPEYGDVVVLWDECYIRKCSPNSFGDAVASVVAKIPFEAFIMDVHGAIRAKDFGTGENLRTLFEGALADRGIRSRQSGSGFFAGSNDPKARIAKGKEWMRQRPSGGPRMRIVPWKLKNFIREAQLYRWKKRPDGTLDDMPFDRNDHLQDCYGMLAQFDPKWHMPVPDEEVKHSAAYLAHLRDEEQDARELNDRNRQHFGPTGPGRSLNDW